MAQKQASKLVSFRLPAKLIEVIELKVRETGKDRTAVVVEALNQVFGVSSGHRAHPVSTHVVEELNQQLRELESQIDTLTNQLGELKQQPVVDNSILERLVILEEAMRNSTTSSVEKGVNPLSESPQRNLPEPIVEPQSHITKQPIQSPESNLSGNLYQDDEVSEMVNKEVEQLLAMIEQQGTLLDQILAVSSDHVFVYDAKGRFAYANQGALQDLGLQLNDLLGKTWQELGFPQETMSHLDTQRDWVIINKRSWRGQACFPTVHGVKDYEYVLSPIFNPDGSVQGIISTIRQLPQNLYDFSES